MNQGFGYHSFLKCHSIHDSTLVKIKIIGKATVVKYQHVHVIIESVHVGFFLKLRHF
jgi:hypothetical protein